MVSPWLLWSENVHGCSVPTCSQPQLHFVVQDVADVQHSTAQPKQMERERHDNVSPVFYNTMIYFIAWALFYFKIYIMQILMRNYERLTKCWNWDSETKRLLSLWTEPTLHHWGGSHEPSLSVNQHYHQHLYQHIYLLSLPACEEAEMWLCPHLVSEQVVFVIDVCVRLWFRKQLLYKLDFLDVFTDMTLEINTQTLNWGSGVLSLTKAVAFRQSLRCDRAIRITNAKCYPEIRLF